MTTFLLNTLSDFFVHLFLKQCSNYKLILKNFNLLFDDPKFGLVMYLRPSWVAFFIRIAYDFKLPRMNYWRK